MAIYIDELIRMAVEGDVAGVRAAVRDDPSVASQRNQFGSSPLHAAHYSGHRELRDLLFEQLLELVQVDIFLVAQLDMVDRVEAFLRSSPALTRATNEAGSTVLHAAAYWCARDTVALLLEHGADPNAVTTSGLQIAPLGSAVATADIPNPAQDEANVLAVVELLLAHGADPNHRRRDGLTALTTAAWRGHIDVVRALLDAGADPTLGGYEGGPHAGDTPESLAIAQGHEAVADLVRDHRERAAGRPTG
jgi:uncharacterized protein